MPLASWIGNVSLFIMHNKKGVHVNESSYRYERFAVLDGATWYGMVEGRGKREGLIVEQTILLFFPIYKPSQSCLGMGNSY